MAWLPVTCDFGYIWKFSFDKLGSQGWNEDQQFLSIGTLLSIVSYMLVNFRAYQMMWFWGVPFFVAKVVKGSSFTMPSFFLTHLVCFVATLSAPCIYVLPTLLGFHSIHDHVIFHMHPWIDIPSRDSHWQWQPLDQWIFAVLPIRLLGQLANLMLMTLLPFVFWELLKYEGRTVKIWYIKAQWFI